MECLTCSRWTKVGATMISTLSFLGTSAEFSSPTSCLIMSVEPLHFQLPPTKNLPWPAIAVTLRKCNPRPLRAADGEGRTLQAPCLETREQRRRVLGHSGRFMVLRLMLTHCQPNSRVLESQPVPVKQIRLHRQQAVEVVVRSATLAVRAAPNN